MKPRLVTKVKALSDIPNQEGFKLRVFTKHGPSVDTVVKRDPKTHHHSLVGVNIKDAVGWEKL